MDPMGKFTLLGSTWEAHIDLYNISSKIRSNEEIDPEVHPLPKLTNPPQPSLLKSGRRGIISKSFISK
jgi:hypothetical protein